MRIAIFGQAAFGREVTERLIALGHEIVGVWVPPDQGRPDPLAELAAAHEWPLFRRAAFRRDGVAIPGALDEYRAASPELNVLPFTTAILPPEIVDHPRHGSICFHPSLLPAFRGGAALSWQIILGARESGVSIFKVTEHVDHGPLVIRRDGITIESTDTMASLYFDKLYPLGVEAMVDAVRAIDDGSVTYTPQDTDGASRQGLVDDAVARIDWNRPAVEVDRLIRGCDPAPGALTQTGGVAVRLYAGALCDRSTGAHPPGTVLAIGEDGIDVATGCGAIRVGKVRVDGQKKMPAAEAGIEPGSRLG